MGDGVDGAVIRPAARGDIPDVAALWCEAFPSKRTVAERARMLETGGRYGGLETALVARDDDGRLLAACKVYRLTQRICGAAMPTMGLAAVAVTPAARRRGLGARLCRHAMLAARARGDLLSALYPFRPDYYERLGWGLVGELHDYRFHTAALPRYDEAGHVRVARGPGDADAIAACYARVVARSNGPIERDARIWAYRLAGEEVGVRPVREGDAAGFGPGAGRWRHRVVVHDRDGVRGYALLRPGRAVEGRPAGIHIRELVAEDEESYRGILGWLAARAERWPVARHTARVEERFGDRLRDPRPPAAGRARSLYFPTARVIRGPMLRILHVPEALERRRYFDARPEPPGGETVIELRIDDPDIPDNGGPWLVRIVGRTGTGVEGKRSPADVSLQTTAATFARIYAGDIAPGDAARLGFATVDGDAGCLDEIFATRERCWLLDEF
jgi:predicted N-acetyltransferase YhbS